MFNSMLQNIHGADSGRATPKAWPSYPEEDATPFTPAAEKQAVNVKESVSVADCGCATRTIPTPARKVSDAGIGKTTGAAE